MSEDNDVNKTLVNLGIEIELGSHTGLTTESVLQRIHWQKTTDPSVSTRLGNYEYRTQPYYQVDYKNPAEQLSVIEENYQALISSLTDVETNASMGTHMHLSNYRRLSLLFSPQALDLVLEEYKKIAKSLLEKKRLPEGGIVPNTGRSGDFFSKWEFCDTDNAVEHHQAVSGNPRYKAINYYPAWNRHKTVEFRFFPTTKTPKTLIKYISLICKILRTIDTWDAELYTASKEDEDSNTESEVKIEEVIF